MFKFSSFLPHCTRQLKIMYTQGMTYTLICKMQSIVQLEYKGFAILHLFLYVTDVECV